jgi:cytochrome c biogenesis protein CcmG/thiol:disulfide interchange protein DsbE
MNIRAKILLFFLLVSTICFAQTKDNKRKLPSVDIKNIDGSTVNTSTLNNDGKPMYISFWALWCTNCIKELNTIADVYSDWQKETGVKVVAISIDDERNKSKVAPFANGKNWEYELYLDPNSDLKRALNINTIPFSFLLNGKGEIVWQHNGYIAGDEEVLYKLLQKLKAGEEID